MAKYYTGVGSRETPTVILDLMREVGEMLAARGWTLRSGGAKGADQAFELGWLDWYLNQKPMPKEPRAEIYLPWNGYEKHDEGACFGANILPREEDAITQRARMIASSIHPNWMACKQGAQKMHTRNVFQVLGQDLNTPSTFLIAYAKEDKHGNPKGGTATAIRLAKENGVKVYNLYREDHLARIERKVREWQREVV